MTIEARALSFGIQPEYEGIGGQVQVAPRRTLEKLLAALGDGTPSPPGDLDLQAPDGVRCYGPDEMPRAWGVALQLYQIRSGRNWGIGDFADLGALAALLARAGADFIGLNPLHALFLSDPARCSPFSPSNRRFLNPLYIAVDRIEGFAQSMADVAELTALRALELVDYPRVAAAKTKALRQVWTAAGCPDAPEGFLREGGEELKRHAVFESLSAYMVEQGHGAGWQSWPEEYHDSAGAAVRDFAAAYSSDIAFHRWLQSQADSQLTQAREACRAAGMSIGLYLDLAVGEAADGSGSWGRADVMTTARIGAPPDYFNETGQDWGLAPLSPATMVQSAAAPFREMVEHATRQAGALRIDHAMGLWQLFLIPEGAGPADGTYVRYPLRAMLTALAAASNANETIVIGEDLGNVPTGFRKVMDDVGILSYRIFFFERTEEGFISPEQYPSNALACLSTHDLPTFRGWWQGDDIRLRASFALISPAAAKEQTDARETERADLLRDLDHAGLGVGETGRDLSHAAMDRLLVSVHAHLARTPSRLFAARIEDLVGETEPVNLPSTLDEYPNWRRKLKIDLDRISDLGSFRDITAALREERPRG